MVLFIGVLLLVVLLDVAPLYVITLRYNTLEFTNAYHLTNLLVKIVTDYRYQANNWTKIAYH